MKDTTRLRYLMQRYIQNSCTREEMDEFFDYVEKSHHDSSLREMLQDFWDADLTIAREPGPAERPGVIVPLYGRKRAWSAIAASVSALMVVGLALYFLTRSGITEVVSEQAMEVTSKSTQEERRLISLPDGSSVWLNSDSKLDYPTTFPADKREVHLVGEAFFDIDHQEGRPFIIYSGQIKTTVLGTAFNIRAFPDEKSVTVTVARGKVLVEDDENRENILVANQQISIVPAADKLLHQHAKVDSVAQWIRQDLILDNITFGEAARIIEERYAVNLTFRDENLKHCRFTSTFLDEASLTQMLTAICIVNRATFQIEGTHVSIDGPGCESRK